MLITLDACGGGGSYADYERFRPESWRPFYASSRKRPFTRTENWDNYKVGKPYRIKGKLYTPKEDPNYSETGVASWYGPKFHNRKTANGEIFDRYGMTAAHRTLPLPSVVKVTNLQNGKSIKVRVNDRGPFAHNRIIDLSERAAGKLGFKEAGVAKVKVEFDRVETAALFHDGVSDKLFRSKPKQRVARHHTSPEHTTLEARTQQFDDHFIQTGAYSSRDSANNIANGLGEIGNVRVEETSFKGNILYRVKVGPYKSSSEAGKALEKVAYMGFNDAILVAN